MTHCQENISNLPKASWFSERFESTAFTLKYSTPLTKSRLNCKFNSLAEVQQVWCFQTYITSPHLFDYFHVLSNPCASSVWSTKLQLYGKGTFAWSIHTRQHLFTFGTSALLLCSDHYNLQRAWISFESKKGQHHFIQIFEVEIKECRYISQMFGHSG